MNSSAPATGTGWSPKIVVSTIVMVLILEAMALGYTIVTTALPAITTEFRTTQGGWLLTAYILAGAVASPLCGKLADIHGKRKVMLWVLGVGLVGAVLSTWSPTFGVLLIGRALQGTIIATLFLTYSLMRDVYPAKVLPMAASISTTGIGLFSIGMPFLVGILLDTWGWRALFAFDVAWMVVLFPLLMLTTPESPVRVRSKVDYLGGLLLGLGLALVLAAVSLLRTVGSLALVMLVVGVLLLAAFVRVSMRRKEPLVDLRVFGRKPVLLAAVCAAAAYSASGVFASVSPLISMTPRAAGGDYGLGLTAFGYAAVSGPQAVLTVLGGVVLGLAIARVGGRRLMVLGLALMGLGGLAAAFWHDSVLQLGAAALLVGLGTGLAYGSIPNLVVAATPVEKQGSIAGMVQVFQSGFASSAPVILFAILAAHARPTPDGSSFVYSAAAMTQGLWFMVGICVVGVLLASTVLRSRAGTAAAEGIPDTAADRPVAAAGTADAAPAGH